MRHGLRQILAAGLLCATGVYTIRPQMAAASPLQCVPYARQLSGVAIHGDAWTWWDKARDRYRRGAQPRPGAVLALANSDVMPLGHVAVVSSIVDARHILLRHANWSGPGVIENDVLAEDSSEDNDWSQVRIWWGQSQQMGARDNPVNGFIYPERISPRAVYAENPVHQAGRRMLVARATAPEPMPVPVEPIRVEARPRLKFDPALFTSNRDTGVTGAPERTLDDIISDVKVTLLARR